MGNWITVCSTTQLYVNGHAKFKNGKLKLYKEKKGMFGENEVENKRTVVPSS